ncbi:hypothetical protein QPL79_08165 [Ignisphaera sp. 4213-co]|uniref:Clan AA aspartic protease n=1 Tax=Ignisphaera cupida TaxID=3050454 RepID=A0ABD4ZAK6_9CREN|nr:hypothetical protein [Ignisphaera sp. 4213-co]MDK6029335.1 hypothetical protein [Ignisphaera sp. 4213-co]
MIEIVIRAEDIIRRAIVIDLDNNLFVDEVFGVVKPFRCVEELANILMSYACRGECEKPHADPVIHAGKVVLVWRGREVTIDGDFFVGIKISSILSNVNMLVRN